jgi:integrase
MKGHIRERSPGHWAIVIDVRDPHTGKRRRRWHSFAGTKRQAQVECARLISEMQGGGSVDPSRVTVGEFLDRFERDWVAINAGARTAERYRDALAHVRRHLGETQLQKVRPAEIAALYATLSRSGLAPRTVQMVHRVLHRALGQAKAWGIIRDNVTETVKPPPAPDQEKEILQPDRARELLERLNGHPLYMLAALALATGARRNELLALRWQDVDVDAGRLRIETALEQTRAHGIRIKAPKNPQGPAHYIATRGHRRATAGALASPAGATPCARHGQVAGRQSRPRHLRRQAAIPRRDHQGVVPRRGCHRNAGCRTAQLAAYPCVNAARVGHDILTISRRIGHASVKVTLDTYGHLIHGTDDRAAQIMDAAFGGNGSKAVADNAKKP